jgi:hypothetical protein
MERTTQVNPRYACPCCDREILCAQFIQHLLDKHSFYVWTEENKKALDTALETKRTCLILQIKPFKFDFFYSALTKNNYRRFECLFSAEEKIKKPSSEKKEFARQVFLQLKGEIKQSVGDVEAYNLLLSDYAIMLRDKKEENRILQKKLELMKRAYEKATGEHWTEEDEEDLSDKVEEELLEEEREEETPLFTGKEVKYYREKMPGVQILPEEIIAWRHEYNRQKKAKSSSNAASTE